MLKLKNYTPHEVIIFSNTVFDSTVRKNRLTDDSEVILTLPSNGILNAQMEEVKDDDLSDALGVPVIKKNVVSIDDIPAGQDIIVSFPFATAAKAAGAIPEGTRLFTINGAVVDDDGKIIGSAGLVLN